MYYVYKCKAGVKKEPTTLFESSKGNMSAFTRAAVVKCRDSFQWSEKKCLLFPGCNTGVGQEMALCLLWAQKSMWSNSSQQKRGAFRISQHFWLFHNVTHAACYNTSHYSSNMEVCVRFCGYFMLFRGTFCCQICIACIQIFDKGIFLLGMGIIGRS